MATQTRQWSSEAREATRRALRELTFPFKDEAVCVKCEDERFGFIAVTDIFNGSFRVTDRDGDMEISFIDVDAMIEAGWVLD